MPSISDYSKIFTDEELEDYLMKNFDKYFNSAREALYSKLSEDKHLGKVVELFYTFLTTPDEVEKIC